MHPFPSFLVVKQSASTKHRGDDVILTQWEQRIPLLQADITGTNQNETTHVPSEWGYPAALRESFDNEA